MEQFVVDAGLELKRWRTEPTWRISLPTIQHGTGKWSLDREELSKLRWLASDWAAFKEEILL